MAKQQCYLVLDYIIFNVDAYTTIEERRLNWIRHNQTTLRSELYSGVKDAILKGDTLVDKLRKRTILPSSHTGSPRFRVQNYQDAMAICRQLGYPDIFITMTCNPKWNGIIKMQAQHGDNSGEIRPEVAARVFHIKLKKMIHDIKKEKIFGRVIGRKYLHFFQLFSFINIIYIYIIIIIIIIII